MLNALFAPEGLRQCPWESPESFWLSHCPEGRWWWPSWFGLPCPQAPEM